MLDISEDSNVIRSIVEELQVTNNDLKLDVKDK